MNMTVTEFFNLFPNDDECLKHLFAAKFNNRMECPYCGFDSKFHKIKSERAYSCQYCGYHIHPTVGTPFEKSRTPLQLWFFAIFLFTKTRHGVSAKELQRQLGVTYKTAWRMGHEIRKHMGMADDPDPLKGAVEVDEGIVGGIQRRADGHKDANKSFVMAAIEKGGRVKAQTIPIKQKEEIQMFVRTRVELRSTLYTDSNKAYAALAYQGYKHKPENHGLHQHGNSPHIDGYFNHLKKSIRGTHTSVSRKHMDKYLMEFNYRYNNRKKPDAMMRELLGKFAKQRFECQ